MGQAPPDNVWVRALARVVGRTLTFTGVTLPAEGTRLGIELEGDVLAGFSEIPEQDDTDGEPTLWAEGTVVGMTVVLDRALPEGCTVVLTAIEPEVPSAAPPDPPAAEALRNHDQFMVESYAVEHLTEDIEVVRTRGTVRGTSVHVDDWQKLPPEGTEWEVTLVALGVGPLSNQWLPELSPEEQSSLDEAVDEAETVEGIPVEVVLALLDDESEQIRGVVRGDGSVELKAPLVRTDRAYAAVLRQTP